MEVSFFLKITFYQQGANLMFSPKSIIMFFIIFDIYKKEKKKRIKCNNFEKYEPMFRKYFMKLAG